MAGPAILAVSKGPQSQFRYCWWYRKSHGIDFDVSEIAGPVWAFKKQLGYFQQETFLADGRTFSFLGFLWLPYLVVFKTLNLSFLGGWSTEDITELHDSCTAWRGDYRVLHPLRASYHTQKL